ncbi:hypothetical protein A6P54_17550 [Bacillus sp. MKU004]|nr:hypothetical protein A6P54_17550 [Bacillus sp. MKU004]
MAEPAKVFISSAAEPGLKQLREQVHTELKMMEHYPLMYEKDFGPWPPQELVENCLEYVGKSDVFLLFVAHRAGNYMESYKATVTHCEFQAAHQNSKHIIVFVQDDIYRLFWYDLRIMMAEMVEEYKKIIKVRNLIPIKILPKQLGINILRRQIVLIPMYGDFYLISTKKGIILSKLPSVLTP